MPAYVGTLKRRRSDRPRRYSAAALGISDPSLRAWLGQAGAAPGTALRSVVVKSTSSSPGTLPAGLTLISPSGYRLRGLDVMSAAALLRVVG